MSIIDSIKSSIFVPIHPAGVPFIIISSIITVLIGWLWSPLFFLGLVITVWCVYFFRNPKRITPATDENNLIVAPADGKIIEISTDSPDCNEC